VDQAHVLSKERL